MKTQPYGPRRTYNTASLLFTLALAILTLAALMFLTSCSINRAFPVGPNPLDEPGASEPTAADLHTKNLSLITENPAYR